MLGKLKNLFSKNKNPLDMPLDKLNESKIKLDIQVKKLEDELSKIDEQITILFEKAKNSKSKSEELTIATKIKTLSQRKKQLQNAHALLNKQMRFVDNLLVIKENEEILKSTPLWNTLNSMSPQELENHLINMKINSENIIGTLNNVLGITDDMLSSASEEHDEDIEDILNTIHAIKEGELDIDDAKEIVSDKKKQEKEDDFEEELKKLDKIIN
ncbi:MAG TPA: hypothetical protein EYG72_02830 [Candidatus Pacebacteria bacterium]|uniref:Uncharacterized protein n=1 Tax=Methanofervidicoccus abyssi TaxID=2082189 RepID=A0A401HRH9_9EURY|nr:hypothetical protein [Methanofervidicoccus abyssi]GBF36884.1 hypothetical protein MHHB_P1114 [Methanofervidicoccus abyssi]HIP21855.1 hypothetical protein [Candidatus Paceibacterota bacterium]HIP34370.1 hypothetical protein [Bacteroidia bacterium]